MEKLWQVLPKIEDELIRQSPEIDPVLLQILYNRGIVDPAEIKIFLEGEFKDLLDPFLFTQMNEAVDLVIEHIKNKKKICIFSDYDADGITSLSVLFDLFSILHGDCFVYIPDRVKEGYGLNKIGIDRMIEQGAQLIITVDNGVRSKEEVDYAQERGVKVIITDHHLPPETKEEEPNCLMLNPNSIGETYPSKTLAGVGVAFKLAQALISKSKLSAEQKDALVKKPLDLVAMGTVADCMVLFGENRILVKEGLRVLNNTKRVGIQELLKVAKIDQRELEAWNIGFQIAPRLNASSRMASAITAFKLLNSKNREEARVCALDLDSKNTARQKVTEEIVDEVESQIIPEDKIIIGIAPKDKPFNEGVIGLAAGRVMEKYYKPVLVFTKGQDGWKASGRSIDELNLAETVEGEKDLLLRQGGHAKACGLGVSEENLDKFVQRIRGVVNEKLKDVVLKPSIKIDADIDINEISKNLVDKINSLAPFGQKNPEPVFLSSGVRIADIFTLGTSGQHLKLKLGAFQAIGFNQAEKFSDLRIGDKIDIVYNLSINDFRGKQSVQLKIIDIKPSNK